MPVIDTVKRLYYGLSMSVLSRQPIGTHVLDRDWDVLLILDTWRTDALDAVADEYQFLSNRESIISRGSNSSEWIAQTFTDERSDELSETALITANANTRRVLERGEMPEEHGNAYISFANWNTIPLDELLHVEQEWTWQNSEEFSHPRPITDRIIEVHRSLRPKRLIAHYHQPHTPYIAQALEDGRSRTELHEHESNPMSYLRQGGEFSKVWEAYLDDLRLVLDEIELILENIDAETVAISADHGEGFGEWGFIYGHGPGIPHPIVRRVPWVETSAQDTGTYEPDTEPPSEEKQSMTERLESLGYL